MTRHRHAARRIAALLLGGQVWLLAAAGEPAKAPAREGQERLFAAAKQGDAEAVRKLLEQGVDPNAEFQIGVNALHYASMRGHTAVAKVLLEHGADVNSHDTVNNFSALTYAAGGGFCDLVELLMARGADLNQRDLISGHTAITLAVAGGHAACVEAMLAANRASPEALVEAAGIARRMRRRELAERLDAAGAASLQVASWPQFRGRGASGVGYGRPVPVQWNAADGTNVAWKVEIPGLAHSSPIVWGERLFLTTSVREGGDPEARIGPPTATVAEEARHVWRLYCLHRASGEILWQRDVSSGVPRTGRHPFNSFASATPATDGRHVAAVLGSEGLLVYDFDGNLLWKQDLGVLALGPVYDPDYHWGSASSPILWRDQVIVQVDRQQGSYLAAFALADGKPRWKTARDEPPSWGTPTITGPEDKPELITNGTNRVRAYDPATGRELWSFKTGNSLITASTPIAGVDLVFVANGFRPLKPIYALRPGGTGESELAPGETANARVAWSLKSGGPYYGTPLLYGELLYVLTDVGGLTAYYSKSGEQVYRVRVGNNERFTASPVAADGKLFLVSEDGDVYVVRAGLEYELLATHPLADPCMATPAIVDGTIYLRSRHYLFAIRQQ